MSDELVIERFLHWERSAPERVYLRQPQPGGGYREYSWREIGEQMRRMAGALYSLGLGKGDRVAIASANSAHWVMADLAITWAGMVSVGLYPKQSTDNVRYVLEHSGAKAIFLGPIAGQEAIIAGIPESVIRISFPYADAPAADCGWDSLLEGSAPLSAPTVDPQALWTLVYTSGTTGRPKGVMLSHGNLAFAGRHSLDTFKLKPDERFFSYLPLAHIAERCAVSAMSLNCGGTVTFLDSIDTFATQLQETAPTRLFAVPAIWAKLRSGVLKQMPQQKLDRLLRIPAVKQLVAYRIRRGLGLHRCRSVLSGAAPLPLELQLWFRRLGVDILQGYAMTENTSYGTVNRPGDNRPGSVGKPLPGVDLEISEDGEILVRSGSTMLGYYRNDEATAKTIAPGSWLRTGDKGYIDDDGYLYVTGRVKDIFKTLKGKYVAPAPIEGVFAGESAIEQVCVLGSGMPQPVAVAVLSPEARQRDWPQLSAQLASTLDNINAMLEPHEKLSHLLVSEYSWTPDNGLITPTLKVRRDQVEERYRSAVDELVRSRETVVRMTGQPDAPPIPAACSSSTMPSSR